MFSVRTCPSNVNQYLNPEIRGQESAHTLAPWSYNYNGFVQKAVEMLQGLGFGDHKNYLLYSLTVHSECPVNLNGGIDLNHKPSMVRLSS